MSYITATVVAADQNADGRVRLGLMYTGDAGEPPVNDEVYINQGTPPAAHFVRGLAMTKLAVLNANRSVRAGIALPLVLDTTTPLPTPPAQTSGDYVAASLPFTPGATPQDVFAIAGSATRDVTVTSMVLTTVQTTAGSNIWTVVQRSTANIAGTSAVVPSVLLRGDPPTAVVRQYTANPTLGTLVGRLWSGRVASPAPGTAVFGLLGVELLRAPIQLAGVNDLLALNFNGAVLPAGLSVIALVRWTEER